MNKPKKRYYKSGLTPAKKKFAKEFAQTENGTLAVKRAYPELAAHSSDGTIGTKAWRLLKNDEVQREIAYQKNALQMIATKAVNRIDRLIDSSDETIAGTNSRWVYEQVHGKAVQKTTSVNMNFTQQLDGTGYQV